MDKPFSPSCERNREPILSVLRNYFADRTDVLEIGSGTGQHAVYFAQALPHLTWRTSDVEANITGIKQWLAEAQLANTPPPVVFDVNGPTPTLKVDAVFSANTLHIMSWAEVEQLFEHLRHILLNDAVLAVYGPFNYKGLFTSESNAQFNQWLQARGVHMAIRDFEAVNELAESIGLSLLADIEMPANNRTLVWRSR